MPDLNFQIIPTSVTIELLPYASVTINSSGATSNLTTTGYLAGESITAYSLVVLVDGEVYLASNQLLSHTSKVIGIARNNAAIGEAVSITTDGIITNDAWNWDTSLNLKLFLGSSGNLTQVPDFNGVFLQEVGTVLGAHQIYLDLQEITLL